MNLKRNSSGVRVGIKAWCLAICFLTFAPFVFAQGPPVPQGGTVVAAGLEGPRGMTFGPDGLLYFAEAGLGGTQPVPQGCQNVPAPVGPYHGGPTARISRIESNGVRTTVVDGLPWRSVVCPREIRMEPRISRSSTASSMPLQLEAGAATGIRIFPILFFVSTYSATPSNWSRT